jgi:hypothetical protein
MPFAVSFEKDRTGAYIMQIQLPWWEQARQLWHAWWGWVGKGALQAAVVSQSQTKHIRWLLLALFGIGLGLQLSQVVLTRPEPVAAFPIVYIPDEQTAAPVELWLGAWSGYPLTPIQDERDLFQDNALSVLRFVGELGTQLPVIIGVGTQHPFYEALRDVRVGDRFEVVAANNGRFVYTIKSITDQEWQPGAWKGSYVGSGVVVVVPLGGFTRQVRVIQGR